MAPLASEGLEIFMEFSFRYNFFPLPNTRCGAGEGVEWHFFLAFPSDVVLSWGHAPANKLLVGWPGSLSQQLTQPLFMTCPLIHFN